MTKLSISADLKEVPVAMGNDGPIMEFKVETLEILSDEVKTDSDRRRVAEKVKGQSLVTLAFLLATIERSYPGSLTEFKKLYKELSAKK